MKVFKFGGASVKDIAGVQNLQKIIDLYPDEKIVVVISAIGKTTNLLENILDAYYDRPSDLPALLSKLKDDHYHIARELTEQNERICSKLETVFENLDNLLSQEHSDNYDFDYDRIVSQGEILSTKLISTYLNIAGLKNQWLDVRQLIRTDNSYREGKVDWNFSVNAIIRKVEEIFSKEKEKIIVTQGFIAGTDERLTTTLGREGSDYSAAIFGYALDAESVTIWKDVPGLLNADPKIFPDAVKLDSIPYEEAIELSYYGATIIHPKTLKPLQNKKIPLFVKNFYKPLEPGSVISNVDFTSPVPSYIFKNNQILITLFPKDFSFISVDNLSEIFSILSENRVKINLMQNSALSFSICMDNKTHQIESIINKLSENYKIKYNDTVQLVTIRHYSNESLDKVLNHKEVIVEQKNRTTIQLIIKDIK